MKGNPAVFVCTNIQHSPEEIRAKLVDDITSNLTWMTQSKQFAIKARKRTNPAVISTLIEQFYELAQSQVKQLAQPYLRRNCNTLLFGVLDGRQIADLARDYSDSAFLEKANQYLNMVDSVYREVITDYRFLCTKAFSPIIDGKLPMDYSKYSKYYSIEYYSKNYSK